MPVRVVDMRGVDLHRWPFDWDLTFAALAAHPDGTIFHRYGGRDERGAGVWLSTESFAAFLRAGAAAYEAYAPNALPRLPLPRLAIEEVPAYARKDKGECIHCHVIHPALREDALAKERWRPSDLWVHPAPRRIGLDLDRDDQRLVTAVLPDTPAAAAGVAVGDRLVRLGPRAMATASDVMALLDRVDAGGAKLPLVVERDGAERPLELVLGKGWKEDTPLGFSWRSSKWPLTPAPGFGGPELSEAEKRERGLPEDAFAFRVNYLVTWGENHRFGDAAVKAGLRKDMIVLGTGAKRDFASLDHFHAWWRLTREPGETVDVIVWQDGAERRIAIPVEE